MHWVLVPRTRTFDPHVTCTVCWWAMSILGYQHQDMYITNPWLQPSLQRFLLFGVQKAQVTLKDHFFRDQQQTNPQKSVKHVKVHGMVDLHPLILVDPETLQFLLAEEVHLDCRMERSRVEWTIKMRTMRNSCERTGRWLNCWLPVILQVILTTSSWLLPCLWS